MEFVGIIRTVSSTAPATSVRYFIFLLFPETLKLSIGIDLRVLNWLEGPPS